MISRKQEWFANWEEEGRSYKLERRSNKAGNYLYCSVRDVGWKMFNICILEGKGLMRGWKITAEKLRSLGVGQKIVGMQKSNVREDTEIPEKRLMDFPKSFAEAVVGTGIGTTEEAVRVRVGKNETVERLGQLESCLVGWWGGGTSPIPDIKSLKHRAWHSWKVIGSLKVEELRRGLWLFDFESPNEARRILREGKGRFGGFPIYLREWGKDVGCMVGSKRGKTAWVRLLGLPLHLWSHLILKRIGDKCGGFDAVDENTARMIDPRWARIRVKWDGASNPRSVVVFEDDKSFVIQLWWEFQPQMQWECWMPEPEGGNESREEGDENPRAIESVKDLAQEIMKKSEKQKGIMHREVGKLVVEVRQPLMEEGWSREEQKLKLVEEQSVGSVRADQELVSRCRMGPTVMGQQMSGAWGRKKALGEARTVLVQSVGWSREEQKLKLVEEQSVGSVQADQELESRCRMGPTVMGQQLSGAWGRKKALGEAGGGEPSNTSAQAAGPEPKQSGPLHFLSPTKMNLSPVHRGLTVSPTKELVSVEEKNCSILSGRKPIMQCKGANSVHYGKEDGRRDEQVLVSSTENDDTRYVRPNHEESFSNMISVFGRPLLMGGSSGQDVSLKLKNLDNLEPLRMVTADGREWGLESSEVLEVIKEGPSGEGQQEEESAYEVSEDLGYEKWEDSCLIKFSEFLGFSTVGFESEILGLLSKIVARQNQAVNKGASSMSRCERELKKLVCTINYEGRSQFKGENKEKGSLMMTVKIISWNVRGVNDPDRRKIIRNFIRNQKVDLVCLQETKIQEMTMVMARSLGVGRLSDWRALNAEGLAGGIILFWDKKAMELVNSEIGLFSISCV